jgi:hypothetical protein
VLPGIASGEVWYDWYTQEAVDAQPGENKTYGLDMPLLTAKECANKLTRCIVGSLLR